MAITINESDAYYIMGKIIGINNYRLTISVTSPFTEEIDFDCNVDYYDQIHPPKSVEYNWEDLRESHPTITEASTYYNTNHKSFFKKEYGAESEWKPTDFEDIYDSNPNLLKNEKKYREKYLFFIDKYLQTLHKGQLCRFKAYPIEKNNRNTHSVQRILVEEYPNKYNWIYDPDSFFTERWITESIDDLVQEIRPSRECVKQLFESYKDDDRIIESIDDLVKEILPSRECVEQLLERHDAADEELKRKEWKEKLERIKSTPERLQNWLTKYNQIFLLLTSSLVGSIVTLIATLLIK